MFKQYFILQTDLSYSISENIKNAISHSHRKLE